MTECIFVHWLNAFSMQTNGCRTGEGVMEDVAKIPTGVSVYLCECASMHTVL